MSEQHNCGECDHLVRTAPDQVVLRCRVWSKPQLEAGAASKCGYGGLPKFWDKEGNLLYQSVYMHDGKILTREERRAALAGGVK